VQWITPFFFLIHEYSDIFLFPEKNTATIHQRMRNVYNVYVLPSTTFNRQFMVANSKLEEVE
jgi:hypothetical protein